MEQHSRPRPLHSGRHHDHRLLRVGDSLRQIPNVPTQDVLQGKEDHVRWLVLCFPPLTQSRIIILLITFLSGGNFFVLLLFWPTQIYNVYGTQTPARLTLD